MTSTSGVGKQQGKAFHHKDTVQMMAAAYSVCIHGDGSIPAGSCEKAAKAQWYAQNVGTVYGKLLITCPLNWKSSDKDGENIVRAAVNSNFFPLYEVEQGETNITYDPEAKKNRCRSATG